MRRVWAILLAAALLLGLAVPVMADGEEFVIEDGVLVQYNGPGGDVVIPDGVKEIGYGVFNENARLTSVTIPDGVTIIGNVAFWNCFNLNSIIFPNSLISIGYNSFGNCAIESITIPGSVKLIENRAFENCDLTSITIPEGVTSIGDYAFASCHSLASASIPESLTSIGRGVFSGCEQLNTVTLPANMTSFGKLFSGCGLKDYTIPYGITTIEAGAFENCTELTSISIPESVTSIGASAFRGCSSLTEVTIPASVTSIEGSTFAECSSLTTVAIPDGVTSIGDSAFYGCTSLTNVKIPESVIKVGYGHTVFYDTPIFTSQIERQEDYICYDHILLSYNGAGGDLVIPDGIRLIADGAFQGYGYFAPAIGHVTLPNGVTIIGDGAFAYSSLTSIDLPDGLTSIGMGAFEYCSQLESVVIPDTVSNIGSDAFDRAGLKTVMLSNSLTTIEERTFSYCSDLVRITIPGSVKKIGGEAFIFCRSLSDVTISDGVTEIEPFAFSYCESLTSVTIPGSVKSIDGAFYLCSNLKSLVIGNGVTTIGGSAFSFCESLTSVTIPNSVTSIGDEAFYYCDSLTDVYYNGTENQWNAIDIGSGNDPLLNATIHFNGGSDPEPVHTHTLTHHAAQPADCTQDGNVEYWYCADCGKYFADAQAERELSAAELTLPALGHDWGAWVRVKQPTATENGRDTRTCNRCGETNSRIVLATTPVTPETPTEPPETSPEPHSFTDVPETAWFAEAVDYAWNNGLMQGVSETAFAPDATATRAMLVTILYRMAKEPEAKASTFADVDTGAWFAEAVAWAAENGVVSGYEDGLFHPERDITREQLVTMLWRMAGQPEAEPVETGAADWAAEAMSWAVGSGVILGDGSGYSPRRTATRAELAAILMRCEQSA